MEAPGIGLSLDLTHATAAVRYHNGTYQNIAYFETEQVYNKKMIDLIRAGDDRDFGGDTIEVLGKTIEKLRLAVARVAGINVTCAAITLPDQLQLQHDEANAILSYASLQNVMVGTPQHGIGHGARLTAISAAYAGRGMGLCADYKDLDACEQQEACMPAHNVLHIDISDESISGTAAVDAISYWWPLVAASFVNTSLGTNAMHSSIAEQEYWQLVRKAICDLAISTLPDRLDYVVLTGTSVTRFETTLKETIRHALEDAGYQHSFEDGPLFGEVLGSRSTIDEPIWLTARGAAEIAKRRQEGPFLCRYDDRTEEQKRPLKDLIKEWEANGLQELKLGKSPSLRLQL